jgi:hypothetical protein
MFLVNVIFPIQSECLPNSRPPRALHAIGPCGDRLAYTIAIKCAEPLAMGSLWPPRECGDCHRCQNIKGVMPKPVHSEGCRAKASRCGRFFRTLLPSGLLNSSPPSIPDSDQCQDYCRFLVNPPGSRRMHRNADHLRYQDELVWLLSPLAYTILLEFRCREHTSLQHKRNPTECKM